MSESGKNLKRTSIALEVIYYLRDHEGADKRRKRKYILM